MVLDWKMGLIGLSLGVLSACSGADESANIAPTPDASAASEIQAPADVISAPEAIVTAAEDITPVVPAGASEAVAETIAETAPSAADLTATADAAAAQLKADTAASLAAEAERAEAARIAAEQTAQTEALAATEARAQASRQAAEAEAAELARAAKAAEDAEVAAAVAKAQEARDAQEAAAAAAAAAAIPADGILTSGTWTKKKRTSKGTWSITREGGELFVKLDDDFSTRNAPDLKIFLSPLSAAEASNANAIDGALLVSLLSSNKGAQSYKIPSGTDLADYNSILIHCEDYTILWSAADL